MQLFEGAGEEEEPEESPDEEAETAPPHPTRLPQAPPGHTLISLPWLQHLAIFKVAQKTKSK